MVLCLCVPSNTDCSFVVQLKKVFFEKKISKWNTNKQQTKFKCHLNVVCQKIQSLFVHFDDVLQRWWLPNKKKQNKIRIMSKYQNNSNDNDKKHLKLNQIWCWWNHQGVHHQASLLLQNDAWWLFWNILNEWMNDVNNNNDNNHS